MKDDQMHLGFDRKRGLVRKRRRHDSRWWFLQMHRAADADRETGLIRRIKNDDFACPNERD